MSPCFAKVLKVFSFFQSSAISSSLAVMMANGLLPDRLISESITSSYCPLKMAKSGCPLRFVPRL